MPNNPRVTFSIVPAQQLAGLTDHKILVIGQLLSGTSGDLVTEIGTNGEEDTLFGARAHLAYMIRGARSVNEETRLDAIGLADDGGATAGTAVVVFAGTATEAGTLTFKIGSGTNHTFEIAVADTDVAITTIADALVAAITADTKAPFTAANVTGTVTITASNGGSLSNSYTITTSGIVAGVTAPVLTGWTGGATDPVLTTLFDAIANIRYQTIIWPDSFDDAVLKAELDARFNVTDDVLDGVGFTRSVDTLANLKAESLALNTENIVLSGTKPKDTATHKGAAVIEFPDVLSAKVGALRALRLTQDAPIASILSAAAPNDAFGGPGTSTLPYFNTLIASVELPNPADMFSFTDEKELNENGIATDGNNKANSDYIFGETVTTALTDAAGNPDTTFKFLNVRDSSGVIREFFFVNNQTRYAQSRLTDGDLVAGFSMENEASIRGFQVELYKELSDIAVTQSGTAAVEDFKTNLVVTTDVPNGKVTINAAPLQVGQIRTILGTIQVNLGG